MILLLLRTHKRNPVFGASAQRISRPSYTAVVALMATCDDRKKKVLVLCLADCAVVSVFGSGEK